MSNGGSVPVASPTGDADGDGVNNATESAIDAQARYQSRIALITAVVALISALLGPLVSLAINHSQIEQQKDQFAKSTQASSDQLTKEARATTDQSEAEFLREQQSTAYADFLTSFNNATLDLLGAAGTFGYGGSRKALISQEKTSIEAVKDVTASYSKVRIVASTKSCDAAQVLYGEFASWSGALLQVEAKVANGQPLTGSEQGMLTNDSTSAEYQKLVTMSASFIEDGREDFSLPTHD